MFKIILATVSPYRKEAFGFLGFDFVVEASQVEEYGQDRPDQPEDLVRYLSRLKAEAVAKNHKEGIVIGFDSVGWFNGRILEKPKSREEGFERLRFLSNQRYQFYTGTHAINLDTGQMASSVSKTDILMRDLTDEEINKYLDQDPHFNTYALGYDSLGHYSSTFASKVEGSYNNFLRGIPLEIIPEMLSSIGHK